MFSARLYPATGGLQEVSCPYGCRRRGGQRQRSGLRKAGLEEAGWRRATVWRQRDVPFQKLAYCSSTCRGADSWSPRHGTPSFQGPLLCVCPPRPPAQPPTPPPPPSSHVPAHNRLTNLDTHTPNWCSIVDH